ncbi:glycosyltransferase involved in cell wall biosynthesis [Geodermatophilus bullaregiensis]|uniref:glycosyltransferase family 4 protein n=1 Tax=Geodermatophilus bullaregiensis TaxID=1564160 RepID=UPI00195A1FCE|nr:glycosyltransferase family 1 protein [Geodermatophilus bullaregiensis]MBM7806995.1 glycosyltransferase involved in cell wall biosynthesis [Geodermatophilus bullaregiensis]
MRVLFDAYWWVEGQPSGRRVVDSLLRTWLTDWPEDELIAAVPARHVSRVRDLAGDPALTVVPLRLKPHGVSVMVEMGGLSGGVDVVLSQNYTPLRSSALRATFIHDLMFVERPEFFGRLERLYFAGMPWSARYAQLVLTSTAAEASRITRLRPRLASRVRPVGLTVPEPFREARAVDPQVGVAPQQFVLCVGRINIRKNLDRLINALMKKDVVRPDFPLVIVGEPDGMAVRGPKRDDPRIRFVGAVDDAGLKWLYEQCRVFVFPSLDEGFGLPVLEAALSGAAMALSDIPAFRELAPGAVFFEPTDEASIARAVGAIIRGPHGDRPVPIPAWSDVVALIRSTILDALAERACLDRRASPPAVAHRRPTPDEPTMRLGRGGSRSTWSGREET